MVSVEVSQDSVFESLELFLGDVLKWQASQWLNLGWETFYSTIDLSRTQSSFQLVHLYSVDGLEMSDHLVVTLEGETA